MISHYKSEIVKPLIVSLLKKEGYDITYDNIKIWSTDTMRAHDVIKACSHIKTNNLSPVLVYTNKVPLKDHIEKKEGIKIFDEELLQVLSIRHDSDLIEYF